MKLRSLHAISEGMFGDKVHDVDEIFRTLSAVSSLVVFSVRTTAIDPYKPYSQITHITAVAISGGTEVGAYNKEAGLSLAVLRNMDRQDREASSGERMPDELTIRDMLNASDYDLAEYEEGSVDKPDEMEVLMGFYKWLNKYSANSILVGHSAELAMEHLTSTFPMQVHIPVLDTMEFTNIYFVPILRAMMKRGSKRAQQMAEKLWDNLSNQLSPTVGNLGRAFSVRQRSWIASTAVEEVRQLGNIFIKMLEFLWKQKAIFSDEHFRDRATTAIDKIRRTATTPI